MSSREEILEGIKSGLRPLADPNGGICIQGVDVQGRLAKPLAEAHIQPLFQATSVDELVDSLQRVQSSLMGLNVFEDVAISVTGEKVVVVQLVPRKKYTLAMGSNFNHQESDGYVRGSVCNKTGWGEDLAADVKNGLSERFSYTLQARAPLPFAKLVDWKAALSAFSTENQMVWLNGEVTRYGVDFKLCQDSGMFLGATAVLRDLRSTRMASSPLMRAFAGESFKLSAFYGFSKDMRVPKPDFFPLTGVGHAVDMQCEVAAGCTTDPFVKYSFKHQSAFRVWRSLSASLNTTAGVIFPFGTGKQTNILDRFNLGGSMDVRSFRFNHLGPHDRSGNASGGEVVLASGLSVYTPFVKKFPNLCLHGFVNAGHLGGLNSQTLNQMLHPSISAGFGLCLFAPAARFELNFGMPLVARAGEWCQKGFQLGIGFDFL